MLTKLLQIILILAAISCKCQTEVVENRTLLKVGFNDHYFNEINNNHDYVKEGCFKALDTISNYSLDFCFKNNKKTGIWSITSNESKLVYVREFVDNNIIWSKTFYSNGYIQLLDSIISQSGNSSHSISKLWREDGSIQFISYDHSWNSGFAINEYTSWYKNGQISAIGKQLNLPFLLDGESKDILDTITLCEYSTIKSFQETGEGIVSGNPESWWEDGKKRHTNEKISGERDKILTTDFWEDGSVRQTGVLKFSNDRLLWVPYGIWKVYKKDGAIASETDHGNW